MNQDLKKAYMDKMEAHLQEWGAMFDVVKARVAKGTAEARVQYHKSWEEWTSKESEFKKRLMELKEAGEEKYESMKESVHKAWEDLSCFVKQNCNKDEKDCSKEENKKHH